MSKAKAPITVKLNKFVSERVVLRHGVLVTYVTHRRKP